MTAEARPPFRAEHVGSLLRPAELRAAYRDFQEGRVDRAELDRVRDASIREAVALQEEVGLRAVTDGEFRRASYWSHFVDRVDGFGVAEARFRFHSESEPERSFLAPHVETKVRRVRPISGPEIDFLIASTDRVPKLTLPSPPTFHFWRGSRGIDPSAYPDREAFFEDLAVVYREEVSDLYRRGARYLQIDEVPLVMLCDASVRRAVAADGEDPDELVASYCDLINACVGGRPADLTLAMHMCRGNFKGSWLSQGGYEATADRVFNQLDVDAFFLEFDSDRAGGFAPLSAVPEGRSVVLGLVSTKRAALEDADDLCRRIEEASRFVPLERLGVSPQCGFASTVAGNPLTVEDEVEKLRRVVEVARRVWGE